jgi:hypothetical protein
MLKIVDIWSTDFDNEYYHYIHASIGSMQVYATGQTPVQAWDKIVSSLVEYYDLNRIMHRKGADARSLR